MSVWSFIMIWSQSHSHLVIWQTNPVVRAFSDEHHLEKSLLIYAGYRHQVSAILTAESVGRLPSPRCRIDFVTVVPVPHVTGLLTESWLRGSGRYTNAWTFGAIDMFSVICNIGEKDFFTLSSQNSLQPNDKISKSIKNLTNIELTSS